MRTFLVCSVFLAASLAVWRAGAETPDGLSAPSGVTTLSGATRPESGGDRAAALYDRLCLACHGTFGDGKGPAAPWLWPRPRDFTRGEYKWRTTPSGAPPADEDLAATIRHGVPGTSMHAFGPVLPSEDITGLIGYLKKFAPEAFAEPAAAIPVPAAPAITDELFARGKEVYARLGCVACHGDDARGDGMAAASLQSAAGEPAPPYDLTSLPLRRPNAGPGPEPVYLSLVTGLSGTAMPAYQGAAPDEDLWAVAAYIDSLRARPETTAAPNPTAVHPIAREMDRKERLARAGYWPGRGTDAETNIFGRTIGFQGPPPASLTPAQGSVNARQCARCHAKQVREWQGSLHAGAGSPGLIAQVERLLRSASKGAGAEVESCQRCHAPLAEQQPVIRPGHRGGDDTSGEYVKNPGFDEELRHQGVNCASCHVRSWQRFGPPRLAGLLGLFGYPLTETPIYERSDLCIGCHQLPPRNGLNSRPLLNTYREWLEGPYMRRGVQCQHCHMPNREHTFKGVHDRDTFRQGIRLEAIAGRSATSGAVSVRARITNVGAGHYLPTTPTPAAWLSITLVDRAGKPIRGARAEKRIGRYLRFEGKFVEVEDTRIPPGESTELSAAWKDGDVARATAARIEVRVAPDDYYEGLYRDRLRQRLDADVRAMFEKALRRAEGSHYVAEERLVAIE